MAPKVFCFIPARSGSVRIPNKNIQQFHGTSLLTHTIQKAFNAKIFSEIYVATDSSAYAEIAHQSGAIIPDLRPRSISTSVCDRVVFVDD